ncbi:hypothetical protein [Natrarchaeobius chitinivorans]|uniref:Uncharacterized protein n=1 Tax=Natrarchaeobius chitinivorans TaxID=1679083 RepID=A0A3N6MCH3_NATCH|nr:hypothetical protein [Natrarchaeobius chitinivorans]RQG94230.1 hypothetical protein EA473_12730 [Natrarchaeobius chitinivorans]
MNAAIWAYPWDIRDRGVESVTQELAEIGIDEVNLAANYHTVHSFSPDNPGQRSYFARASSYFQPSDSYGTLEPVPAEAMGDADWVREIAAGFDGTGISLNAWTVGVHNSRLGLDRPDLTLTSPYGDSLPFALCPSQPAVRTYLTTLVRDLDADDAFDAIELEAFDFFHGSGFGWHHDKVFAELGDLGEFLLGLCFCDACRERAADAGVDVETARKTCVETLDAIASRQLPPSTAPLEWLRAHPAVEAYVAYREETVADLFADLRETADCDLGYYVGLLDVGDEWMFGADLEALGEHVDYYTAIAYESTPRGAAERIQTATELAGSTPVHAGIQPGPPLVDDGETVRAIVDAVVDAGADRVSFYNYGPLPQRSLEWIGDAIDSHR